MNEYLIEMLTNVLDMLNEGDITFSEAGDWLHNHGDEILNELKGEG